MPLGYEFSPQQDKRLRNGLNRPSDGMLNPAAQQAIKILSLRLPNMLGGRPPAPADLLKPPVGGNAGPGAVAESIMQTSGAGRPSSLSDSPPALSTPSMASPTSMPFTTATPSAGRGESGALAALVGGALGSGGGRAPDPSLRFGAQLHPDPIADAPAASPSFDVASLMELLKRGTTDIGGGFGGDFGNEG
jgi:hypothetical protein